MGCPWFIACAVSNACCSVVVSEKDVGGGASSVIVPIVSGVNEFLQTPTVLAEKN